MPADCGGGSELVGVGEIRADEPENEGDGGDNEADAEDGKETESDAALDGFLGDFCSGGSTASWVEELFATRWCGVGARGAEHFLCDFVGGEVDFVVETLLDDLDSGFFVDDVFNVASVHYRLVGGGFIGGC